MTRADVVVVGGGVAGLAAAGHLAQAGREVVLLEARNRLGGRIHTIVDSSTGHPIELGAEFIQGRPEALLRIVRREGLALQEIDERHVRSSRGKRRRLPDAEKLLDRLLQRDGDLPDMPIAELLRMRARFFSSEELEAITSYLEGFHAADLGRFGTTALAENQQAEDQDAESLYRLAGGYGQLVDRLASELISGGGLIRTGVVVTGLSWKPGSVVVKARADGGAVELTAGQAVLALPLSNLKGSKTDEGAVFPDPAPEGWAHALQRLEVGPAQHIVLRFEHAWWIEPNQRPPVFVHGRGEPVPVWWTSSPPEIPFLTGWAGGPPAARLAGKTLKQLVPLALESAARIFGVPARKLANDLRAAYSHDWSTDPYSRGAYSYGGVGALPARKLLRKPVASTLVLSGEALAEGGHNGTVPGALSSGHRSAEALLG